MEKWSSMGKLCEHPSDYEPDELATAYQELTTDLAFAQTHYPDAQITIYLNDLALALHAQIYRRHPGRWRQVWQFVVYDVPQTFYDGRWALLASLGVFLFGLVLGVVSQVMDPNYVRCVLGDYYVEMTLENIQNGTPMAVYDGDNQTDMFLSITINNIGVAFRCYAMGLLTVFGTGVLLIYNSLMLGCFQTFFVQHQLGYESALAIWMHGTIEISSIIVAGAAGIQLGTGWIYPGSLPRIQAFQRAARKSLRMVTGTVPLFIVAGFIEGFFTRHVEWPDGVRMGVILASLAFIVWYVIVWPQKMQQPVEHYVGFKRLVRKVFASLTKRKVRLHTPFIPNQERK